jgi:tetratricopeptide (TPR) repeat protein
MWRQALAVCLLAAAPLLGQDGSFRTLSASFDEQCRRGDFAAARSLIMSALQDGEATNDLLRTGTLLWFLALANGFLFDVDEADLRFRAAIATLQRAGPQGVITLARTQADYATLLALRQSEKHAERLRLLALKTLTHELGPAHPAVLSISVDLAFGHYRQRHYARAERLCREVISTAESTGRPAELYLAKAFVTLGRILLGHGRTAEAEGHFARSAMLIESYAGPEHPTLLNSWLGLALVHTRMRQFKAAADLLNRSERVALDALGPRSPTFLEILSARCELLRAEGKTAEAKKLEKSVRNLAKAARERSHSVSWSEWTAAARR